MTFSSVVTVSDEEYDKIKNTVAMGVYVEGEHNLPENIKQRVYTNMKVTKMEKSR